MHAVLQTVRFKLWSTEPHASPPMKNAVRRRINSSPSAMDYQDVASLVSLCLSVLFPSCVNTTQRHARELPVGTYLAYIIHNYIPPCHQPLFLNSVRNRCSSGRQQIERVALQRAMSFALLYTFLRFFHLCMSLLMVQLQSRSVDIS